MIDLKSWILFVELAPIKAREYFWSLPGEEAIKLWAYTCLSDDVPSEISAIIIRESEPGSFAIILNRYPEMVDFYINEIRDIKKGR